MSLESLYYWKDPVVSGILFGAILVFLLSLNYFSLISVFAYASLCILSSVTSLKIVSYVMIHVLKKEFVNPLTKYSGADLTIPKDKVLGMAESLTQRTNHFISELRRLFLVDNMVDSLKFGLALWFLTYLGSLFNMMTLILLFWIGLFTIPKLYINNKASIDPVVKQGLDKYHDIMGKVLSMTSSKSGAQESKKEE